MSSSKKKKRSKAVSEQEALADKEKLADGKRVEAWKDAKEKAEALDKKEREEEEKEEDDDAEVYQRFKAAKHAADVPWPCQTTIIHSFTKEAAADEFTASLKEAAKVFGGPRPKIPFTPHEDLILRMVLMRMRKMVPTRQTPNLRYTVRLPYLCFSPAKISPAPHHMPRPPRHASPLGCRTAPISCAWRSSGASGWTCGRSTGAPCSTCRTA